MSVEVPWIDLRDACSAFGVTYETAKNKILYGKFPVPTYKLGKRTVIDKEVYDAYFAKQRAVGLAKLKA